MSQNCLDIFYMAEWISCEAFIGSQDNKRSSLDCVFKNQSLIFFSNKKCACSLPYSLHFLLVLKTGSRWGSGYNLKVLRVLIKVLTKVLILIVTA